MLVSELIDRRAVDMQVGLFAEVLDTGLSVHWQLLEISCSYICHEPLSLFLKVGGKLTFINM